MTIAEIQQRQNRKAPLQRNATASAEDRIPRGKYDDV